MIQVMHTIGFNNVFFFKIIFNLIIRKPSACNFFLHQTIIFFKKLELHMRLN